MIIIIKLTNSKKIERSEEMEQFKNGAANGSKQTVLFVW